MTDIPVNSVKVGPRFRRDVGDIADLADSIMMFGLLHQIVVDAEFNLVAGYRRLSAYKYLLKKYIPATIISDVDDPQLIEIEENTKRKDFTVDEIKEIYDYR